MRHLLSSSLLTILTMALAAPSAPVGAGPCAFPSFTPPRPLVSGASGVLPGDFDEDGDTDLLTSIYVSGSTTTPFLLENRGGGAFATPTPLPARSSPLLAATGDFDGDGRLDILLRRSAARTVSVLLGDGHGGFLESAESDAGASGSVAAGDLDGDGRLDVVIVGRDPADGTRWVLSFLKGDGRAGFDAPVVQRLETAISPIAATTADLDRDGRAELLISFHAHRCGRTSVYRRDGHGIFAESSSASLFGDGVVLADMNGDDILDAVGTCSNFGNGLEVALGIGDGTFRVTTRRQVGAYGFSYGGVVADFDGDGTLDVLSPASPGTFLLRGDGKGGLGAEETVFPMEELLLATDLDGDALPDLVTGRFDGHRDIRLNACGRSGGSESTFLVPFLYRGNGANTAVFTPDLLLVNRGGTTATVEASYTATIGSGRSRGFSTLPGGVQRSSGFADLGVSVSAAQGTWGGTLRLRFSGLASPDDAFALAGMASRTGGDSEVGGVGLPAIPLADTLSGPAVIGWLREDARDRTNLVLINAGDEADGEVVLRVTVVSTDPSRPGSVTLPDVTLTPGSVAQLDRVLRAARLGASGFAKVERVAGATPYWAYAVVNDNGSSDGSIVPPLAAGRRSGQTLLVLPALVESGAFYSELILTNASPSPRRLNLSWTSDGLSTPDHTVRLTIDLLPSEQLYVPSFVAWLRELGVEGVGSPGASYAGALFLTVEDGDVEGIFAGARISSSGRAGRYGVFMAASSLAELATEEAWVYGLEQAKSQPEGSYAGVRTNLAIVNAGETPSIFRVDLFDSNGATVGSLEDLRVDGRGWLQIPSVLFPLFSASQQSMSAYARIRSVSGSGPYFAYGVLNQGAGPGGGSGDGRILPMRPAPANR